MENNKDYYSTYKFYDSRYRRLSAFAEVKEGDNVQVVIFTLSGKDNITEEGTNIGKDVFSKKTAEAIYRRWKRDPSLSKPLVVNIPFLEGKGPKLTFLRYMEDTYYKMHTVPFEIDVLLSKDRMGRMVSKPRFSLVMAAMLEEWDSDYDVTNN